MGYPQRIDAANAVFAMNPLAWLGICQIGSDLGRSQETVFVQVHLNEGL
jgi:hypothetical protein